MPGRGDLNCAKKLVADAERILQAGRGCCRWPLKTREQLWGEILAQYQRFQDHECGTLPRDIDQHIRSKFEVALLTLAVSFRANGESCPDIETSRNGEIFNDDEIALFEIIDRYQVLPGKEDLKKMLLARSGGDSDFVKDLIHVHYTYIDGLVTGMLSGESNRVNPLIIQYMKKEWKRFDSTLSNAVIDAIKANGMHWFFTFASKGGGRAEQVVYQISGGHVNIGSGVQIVDSLLSRTGISNEQESGGLFPRVGKEADSQGGVSVTDSLVSRSSIGGAGEHCFCPECGGKNGSDAKFCIQCGGRLR
ncbi:zinc ribbon domain-containing protein [Methanocalculus taiwanensis]|uniref:Zinc ribbon domain-containing protein n=1 Tax=Methanocalculus taiwanensis TaxID=106207 RepID=A0ABD4TPD4_9EURY|nr:zinc ribbon domain-containing protein [Methanocalculus taiwanensis]MCQ1539512.1 zinc ribbon domain-containing protein [Methanocalculus taiwanensis]